MMVTTSKTTQETANEILNFFLLFSNQAKLDNKRKHHLTAGHLSVMMAIPESFEDGKHLIEQFTVSKIYKTLGKMGLQEKWPMVKKNLNELSKLGFLQKNDVFYSYSIVLNKQDIN